MLSTAHPIPIAWLRFGINIVFINGISSKGVTTAFSGEDLSTTVTLEKQDFVQSSESTMTDTKASDVRYDNESRVFENSPQMTNITTTNYLSGKSNPETFFLWTSSSAADDSIIHFTGSNESLTIETNIEFDEDAQSNNTTGKKDWTTQPLWYLLDSELDNEQSDEANQFLSKKTADDFIFVFFFILEPLVAVAGCVCNTFNIIVLRKQGLRESTACYLFAMTLADFAFLVFTLVNCIFTSLKNHSYPVYVQWATWMHHDLFHRFFVIIFERISNYFVAVLSIERFIAVRFPLGIKFTPLSRHPKKIITGVCVFVSALLVPNIFRTEFTQIHEPYTNTTVTKYTLTEFHDFNQEFYVYYTYFILALLRLVPSLTVFFLNLGIIIVLKGSRTQIKNINAGDTMRQVKQIKITRMLVAIAVIFLICMLPGLIHSLLAVFYRPYYLDSKNLWEAVHHIYPLFDIINSTVNFIVYIILSKKFYAIFLETFCRKHKKVEQNFASNSSELGETLNTSI